MRRDRRQPPALVPVRDTKLPHSPTLLLPATAWTPFLASLQNPTP
ncbi:DUF397 domain-containing protein [Streptomyces sp. ST1015]|nr:DUF397 domain-containing protein [Streptomyces sp. ST1015]